MINQLSHIKKKRVLHVCIILCKKKYLYVFQLAGVVAVEVTGGPTIQFVPGRKVHSSFNAILIMLCLISLVISVTIYLYYTIIVVI